MEPPNSASFLERYRQARSAPSTPVAAPAVSPASPPSPTPPLTESPKAVPRRAAAAQIWGSVFHPLGRSPTNASRYDHTPDPHGQGQSVSEIHDSGRASAINIGKLPD